MQREKRPFYIIGHNPNTIEEAKGFLDNGANGLEPDIVYAEGRFYVCHNPMPSYENIPTVEMYLTELKELLLAKQYNLALMIWDMKETDFDPNELIALVKENFSGGPCDGVTMLLTHSDDHAFVNRYRGDYVNVGVGVDESDVAPAELEQIFKGGGQKNLSYADGIITFLDKPGIFKNITAAQQCRNQHKPGSFSLIYTWVLSQEASMRRYLDTYIDGIMVDVASVSKLKDLVSTTPYSDAYQLAQNGYNPFRAERIPGYWLTIKTSNKLFAGTDAKFIFTLKGNSGNALSSLPFNANTPGELERGSISQVFIEGADLGEIVSLEVEALTNGLDAGWLPEHITVESPLLEKPVHFDFEARQDWVSKKKGVVIKTATA
jgi:hypothetical protein